MHNVTTSRHIRTSSELMIMVPIKNEFVPITDLVMTYASRISVVLRALAELRQLKVERGFDNPIGPIERLQTIYRVQWTVIEPFDDVSTSDRSVTRQVHGPQVVLTSHFDSSWEDYFQALVTTGGPLLDLIFSHCQDYEGFSCKDGYEAFSSFIRRHQRRCDFLYVTAPEVTIGDIRYFTRYSSSSHGLAPSVPSVENEAFAINAQQHSATVHDERTRSSLRAIHGLHDIQQRLFLDAGGLPATKGGHSARSDRQLYEEAVASTLVLEPEFHRLGSVLKALAKSTDSSVEPVMSRPALARAAAWVRTIVKELDPQPKPPSKTPLKDAETALGNAPPSKLSPNDIDTLMSEAQGNILNSFPATDFAKLVLVRCHDGAGLQRVLTWATNNFTSERASREGSAAVRINLGITHSGLKLLQLPQHVMELFPREFREGMEERAGLLGDVAHNHPRNWQLPLHPHEPERTHLSTVHAALVLQGESTRVTALLTQLEEANKPGELVHTLDLHPTKEQELSQPIPPAALRSTSANQVSALDVQALGEFLLGYENNAGVVATCTRSDRTDPSWTSVFKNSSFMAMRKMRKDQTAIDAYVEQILHDIIGKQPPDDRLLKDLREDVHALVMGRRPNGAMLGALQPAPGAPANAFDFSGDAEGALCPLDSHVRRTNPRQHNTPRIARRGIPYRQPATGPDEKEEHGLLFMAYCASLSNQYEIVQRWVNGSNSSGVLSRQNDPLCGAPLDSSTPRIVDITNTIAKKLPVAKTIIALQPPAAPFVTLRWGLYLFMPSRAAIQRLQHFQPEPRTVLDAERIERGKARIAELDALPPERRTHEWKRLLEEVPEADSPQALHARDVAAAITAGGGAFKFTGVHGTGAEAHEVTVVVVTKAELARTVLSNSEEFSVKEYRKRLQQALADHYLGYDLSTVDPATGLTYAQLSAAANKKFQELSIQAAQDARIATEAILKAPGSLDLDPDGQPLDKHHRTTISVAELAQAVIGMLCQQWLQMPGADDPDYKEDKTRSLMFAVKRLLIASRYCFQALPVPYLAQEAAKNKDAILADYQPLDITKSDVAQAALYSFATRDQQRGVYGPPSAALSPEEQQRLSITTLLGAVGFAPPAVGAITRILDYWIETEQLWQIQRASRNDDKVLRRAIIDALGKVPAPPTLYRTTTAQARPLGKLTSASADALVIINLAAVYEDAVRSGDRTAASWFFGGPHGGTLRDTPQHGCPGQDAGMLAIEAIIATLLQQTNIRRERRLLLSFDRIPATA